jgi:glycosyltransferase involved in cell wall biosynthesis
MKIAINALWRATSPSGICRHAANLARSLCTRNEIERVFLIIGYWQTLYFADAFRLTHNKLSIIPVRIVNSAFARNLWYLTGLPRLVKLLGSDLVHLSFPVPIMAKRWSVPIAATLHDLYPYDAPDNFGFPRVLGHRLFLQAYIKYSDHIICDSEFTLGRLTRLFGEGIGSRASRIYNCVELLGICERQPALCELNDRPFVLCVAQHRRNKNFALLLRGFAALLRERIVTDETLLLLVGSKGPETPLISRLISALALRANVRMAQDITDAELAWLYRNTLLSVCTSTVEGFGLPLAEALQYGTPTVCSDIPVFREVGGDSCTFFSLDNANPVHGFLRACQVALQSSSRPIAHRYLFSADTIGAQHAAVYSELLHGQNAKEAQAHR